MCLSFSGIVVMIPCFFQIIQTESTFSISFMHLYDKTWCGVDYVRMEEDRKWDPSKAYSTANQLYVSIDTSNLVIPITQRKGFMQLYQK